MGEYLYKPFGMNHTTYQPFYFPAMAIGALSPGNDIHSLLQKVLNYEVIPKSIMDQVDFDYSFRVSGSPKGSTDGWWGHYGLGSWVECLGFGIAPKVNSDAPLQPRCKALNIHSFPGGSGVYPLIAKPVTDVLVGGHTLADVSEADLLHNLGGLIPRDLAYISSTLKSCTCENETRKGEPFKTLLEGLPAKNSTMNRNHYLQLNNSGVTLRRLIKVSKDLGVCTCEARSSAAPIQRRWDVARAL